jgi:glutamate synthase (ferredoxin)
LRSCSICNGIKSNDIIHKALDIIKLEHRGASADGELEMVILFDIPHDFFKKVCDFEIQQQNNMPWKCLSPNQVVFLQNHFEASIKDQKLEILGWRQFQLTHQI